MIRVSRCRLRISWLSVMSCVSRSPVTVDLTNASGTCWRSTSTTARPVHRRSRKTGFGAWAVRRRTKGRSAGTRLRRTVSRIVAMPTPRPGSLTGVLMAAPRSRDHDHVARLEDDVLLVSRVGDGAVVVEAELLGLSVGLGPDHGDLARRGEVTEPTGHRDGLEDGRGATQLEHARLLHLTEHRDSHGVDLDDAHRDLGIGQELRQGLGDLVTELHGREASGLDVVQERHRDLAVR